MGFDSVFPQGPPNEAFADYFTGQSYLAPLAGLGMSVSSVTFEPGCRNHWHRHNAASGGGQILLAVAGSGWYQAEGQEPVSLAAGTVVEVPPGQKHWHGAKADSWFSHIAISVPGEDTSTEWLEPVDDEHYAQLTAPGSINDPETEV